MPGYSEIELKLRLTDKNKYSELLHNPAIPGVKQASVPETVEYETTYYDTSDHRLSRNYLAYRIRKTGNTSIVTVKDSGACLGGLHIRHEWEKELAGNTPTIQPFSALPIGNKLYELVGQDTLTPLFKTVFKRTIIDLTTESGSNIEMAADRGDIISGDKKEPLCEIELELISGQVTDLLKIGSILSGQYPLLLEERSKFYRGLILAGHSVAEKQIWEPEVTKKQFSNYKPHENLIICIQEIMRLQMIYLKSPQEIETVCQLKDKAYECLDLAYLLKSEFTRTQYTTIQDKLQNMADTFQRLLPTKNIQVKREAATINPDLLMNNNPVWAEPPAEALEPAGYEKEQLEVYHSLSQGSLTPDLLMVWAWALPL